MPRSRSWSDEQLVTAVASEVTMADVARRLGLRPSGGVHTMLVHHVRRLGLDTGHMLGQRVGKGRRFLKQPRPLSEVLVVNSTYMSTGALRRRLIAAGLKEARCETCGLVEWLGQPIRLELDHVNGDRSDNRLQNLRILCPNCHSQTETWCRSKAATPA